MNAKIVVIGASAGGLKAILTLLKELGTDFPLPVVITQHIGNQSSGYLEEYLTRETGFQVKEAEDKESVAPGHVYVAPPNYHLLLEDDYTLSLSVEGKVNFSRPSIDVMFESAALAYGKGVIGIILTGANNDGSKGLKAIIEWGGKAIVQDPKTAEVDAMPLASIQLVPNAMILSLKDIAKELKNSVVD